MASTPNWCQKGTEPSRRSHTNVAETAQLRPAPWEQTLSIAACGALFHAVLVLHLYARKNPFGAAFAMDPFHYVFHAAFYGAWSYALLALPFLLWSRSGPSKLRNGLHVGLSFILLVLTAVDHECQRFLGMHMTLDWLATYGEVERTPGVIFDSMAQDLGGAWSSLHGFPVCLSFLVVAQLFARHFSFSFTQAHRRAWMLAASLLCVILPTLLWHVIPGGRQRQSKVAPSLVLVFRELAAPKVEPVSAEAVAEATRLYQQRWASLDTTGLWAFSNPEYPLRKYLQGAPPAPVAEAPNFIVLSLETFRAKDMKSMNEVYQGPTTTPFLDSLAGSPNSAAYVRYYASGVPTVYAFMSIHTGLLPHPRKGIHNSATTKRIEGFPEALRGRGYRTLHFTGSDPDWDGQRVWLSRWYDEIDYTPDDREQDRRTFQRAAKRLKDVGRSQGPFFAYLSSISNHTPFRSPEPNLDLTPGETARDRLHNTMHYTDDVVRELYESLQNEPWFARTIWIITGDHGFDLGDRGESGGHQNLRHETTWVPLIVHGEDARLPRGKQLTVASHLDLAPTITELAGVFADNSYMGHSLLHKDPERADAVIGRASNYAYEGPSASLFKGQAMATALVYASSDLEQRESVAASSDLLEYASSVAHIHDLLVGYTVDHDRVVPPPSMKVALEGVRR